MIKTTDIIGKFFLGAGGIGDALLTLSTFYDDVDEANIIFLANDTVKLKELFSYFPKIKKKLIIQNDFNWLKEFYHHPNCIGTGILPKDLNYNNWYKVNIFKEYGVKKNPNFVELFEPIRVNKNYNQIFIQQSGSEYEGNMKKRILNNSAIDEINKLGDNNTIKLWLTSDSNKKTLKDVFQFIRGSDLIISVDSFSKTFSSLCGIQTIVYDNIYDEQYLNCFKEKTDAGHFVFIYPWNNITFRTDIESHKKSYENFKLIL